MTAIEIVVYFFYSLDDLELDSNKTTSDRLVEESAWQDNNQLTLSSHSEQRIVFNYF